MKGNVLVLKNLKKNNPWCDKDHVMLCACFQLLVDFLEKEKPERFMDVKHDAPQRRQYKEWRALYRYWKRDRPRLIAEESKALMRWAKTYKYRIEASGKNRGRLVTIHNDRRLSRIHQRLEEKLHKTDEEMLRRLIDVRNKLWC